MRLQADFITCRAEPSPLCQDAAPTGPAPGYDVRGRGFYRQQIPRLHALWPTSACKMPGLDCTHRASSPCAASTPAAAASATMLGRQLDNAPLSILSGWLQPAAYAGSWAVPGSSASQRRHASRYPATVRPWPSSRGIRSTAETCPGSRVETEDGIPRRTVPAVMSRQI